METFYLHTLSLFLRIFVINGYKLNYNEKLPYSIGSKYIKKKKKN